MTDIDRRRVARRRLWLAITGLLALIALGAAAVPARAAAEKAFDRNISATGDWHAGEPEIAVNPRDAKNVVMVWPEENATGIYRNPATGTFNVATGTGVGYANDPAFSRCGLAVSFDGGVSWRRSVLPAQTAQSTLCSDAAVAAGPDGTFYATVITFHVPSPPLPGVPPGTLPPLSPDFDPGQGSADAVITSTDGGRTWTYPPVDAIGNRGDDAKRYAPGTDPETGGEGTNDRPWVVVDQSDGTVYVRGLADFIQFNGTAKTEGWVTSSRDHAESFGTIYPVDNAEFPETGAAHIAAAHGVLAVAYIGQHAPDNTSVVVLATSRDHGKTFTRHVLSAPVSGGAGSVIGVNVAADPTRAGSYAVMVPTSTATGVLIYRTDDGGATWTKPASAAVGTSRPWLAWSPDGRVLGVMGRDIPSSGTQDVLVSFSTDRGTTFGPPTRANSTTTPPTPPGAITLYDDVSWITLSDRYAFVGWGDWRRSADDPNGEVNAWMARIPTNSLLAVAGERAAVSSSGGGVSTPASGQSGGALPATGLVRWWPAFAAALLGAGFALRRAIHQRRVRIDH